MIPIVEYAVRTREGGIMPCRSLREAEALADSTDPAGDFQPIYPGAEVVRRTVTPWVRANRTT